MLTPIEETGLAGARLAARVQRAMHQIPEAELGALLGRYQSEAEALAAVRALCEHSNGLRAALGLIRDGTTLVASGDELVERALSRA